MKILRTTSSMNFSFQSETDFKTNLGWEENFQEFEDETLVSIINPIENYETTRYIHEAYTESGILKSDIWFYFYFLDGSNAYDYGLDYNLIGISHQENSMMLKQSTKSFFRLEFFTTPNRETQKLIFAKSLSLPLGQKVFLTNIGDYIHVPVFTGNNYKNSENMYLFWFQDGSVYSGSTFYMSARFFNAEDGSITPFVNKDTGTTINDVNDLYYEVEMDMTNHSYVVYEYDGTTGSRVGKIATPINYYEIKT